MENLQRAVVNTAVLGRMKKCTQCGATIFAACWSELVNGRYVRNGWSCDDCGHQYETSSYFPILNDTLSGEVAGDVEGTIREAVE
jgi:ribosomal protein L37AE/L43A